MTDKTDRLLHVAFHEGSHTIIARRLGFDWRAASIIPAQESDGHTAFAKPFATILSHPRGERAGVTRYLVTLMAGEIAEQFFLGHIIDDDDGPGASADAVMIGEMTDDYSEFRPDAPLFDFHHLSAVTERLVRRHADEITEMALRLIMFSTLAASP